MKKMKQVLCLIMTLCVLVAGMSACGTKDTDKSTGDNTTADGGSKDTDAAKFVIGGIGPISGDAAVYGQSVKNGAELAVKEINAAGGINGTQLEFLFEDDEADGEKATNAYNTLKDQGMQILMGTVTSGACASVIENTNTDNMFQLTPSASSKDVLKYRNFFQVCFTDPNQGIASAQYIGDKKVATKVAVIYDSSDIYSSGIYEKFVEEAANKGLEIVAAEAFTADSKSDFSVQLQKAKDSGAELVFLPIYYKEAALILQQASDLDFSPIFFGCDGLDGILTVENFKAELAEGLMLLTPFAADATDEKTVKFVTDYKAAYTDTPNQFAADAYDAIYTIKSAIEKSGATSDMSVSDLGDALKAAMPEITVDGLTGLGMTWAETGEVNKAPRAIVIKEGAYVSAE